ncbi:NADH-quinone oxidoreductase subunit L [Bdellovibrionota bacterium FG-1]
MHLLENPWIIPALPLLSFLIVGFVIRPLSERAAGWAGTFSLFCAAVASYALAFEYFGSHGAGTAPLTAWSFEWLRFQSGLTVSMGVMIDPISVMMLVVVTTVSFLVHIYSTGYMQGESGYGRFYTYLSLFTFSMLGLVVAPNIFQMYVFWELVGVSSFLLIGFYYQKPSAVAASKKAFIVTRFADLGFLIGILTLAYFGFQIPHEATGVQPLDFAFLTDPQNLSQLSQTGYLTFALILIYCGAAGKSAMFPLHIWLPDAMEGPTPVSALIHAATMVVAGVYLVARLFPVFAFAPNALEVVAVVGLFTSAFAAVIACTQDDIKRVLAFSTLSQLGYMMFALGIATMEHPQGYTASMFHLFNHAFFKALLFLGAGSVIHAVHTNNVWEMGGLRKKMPVTHLTFLIAVLAIAGIWPFSGFFSKDEILGAAVEGHRWFHFVGGLTVAALTSFYMARIYLLTFWGKPRDHHSDHAHEAPFAMLLPLVILAVLSCTTGFIPFGEFVGISAEHEHEHAGINLAVAIPGTLAAVIGLGLSWFFYGRQSTRQIEGIAQSMGGLYTTIKKKFYFDEIYLFITHKIIFRWIAAPVAWFDRNVVDGAVNLSGSLTRKLGGTITLAQSGQLQTYGLWLVSGTVTLLALYWMTVG